jgi:hypothetical protein
MSMQHLTEHEQLAPTFPLKTSYSLTQAVSRDCVWPPGFVVSQPSRSFVAIPVNGSLSLLGAPRKWGKKEIQKCRTYMLSGIVSG